MNTLLKASLLAAALAATGCAGTIVPPHYQYTATGAALGAAGGALVGHRIEGKKGAYIGGAAGALIGGAIGNNMDQQRRYGYQGGYQGGYQTPYQPPYYQSSQYPANPWTPPSF